MINIAIFDTSLTAITTPTNFASGYTINSQLPAQHFNYFMNAFSVGAIEIENVITNTLTPGTMANVGAPGGTAGLVSTDYTQLLKSIIATSHLVGENIESEIKQTPVAWTAATFSSYATQYKPIIDRSVDQVVSSTNAPDLVTLMRAEQVSMNVSGSTVTSWTGTVSGSTITLTSTTNNNALLNLLSNEFIANGFVNGTQAAASTSLYTYNSGATSRCINVAGTDYAITNVNTGTLTITVSGTPTAGSQTLILYPYRIAGSSTTVLLPKISGFVGVPQFDYDGEVVGGFKRMDRMLGHRHAPLTGTNFLSLGGSVQLFSSGSNASAPTTTGDPITDGTNGTPRTGKTNDPRTRGVYVYTWAGRLLP